jgi:Leucine-rich repeat (LRR) protein
MEKSPKQIYIDYKRNIIDQRSAAEQIIYLFEKSEIHRERIECLEILCRVKLREEKIFNFLENLVITDVDENVRIVAANCLKNLFLEKAFLPIKWAYLHEISIFCLIAFISLIADIVIETCSSEVHLFLLNQVKKIDNFQFRNSLKLNIDDEIILSLSDNKLATIIKNYLLIKHFNKYSSNFTFRVKLGLISGLNLESVNKNASGWNIVKKSFDFIEIYESLLALDLKDNKITELPASIGSLRKLRYLNLSYNDLKILPKSIGLLKNLNYLILSHNRIKDLPTSIRKLTVLKTLDLRHNNLNVIPPQLNNLNNLINLDLHGNQLSDLIYSNLRLKSLKKLDLGLNKLKTIPKWFAFLDSLRILNLGSNRITQDYKLLSKLKSITSLNLSDNSFKTLSSRIKLLRSLKVLNLSNNQLSSLPNELMTLSLLRNLDLSWNNFTTLPEWISRLSSLETLNLRGNKLERLPNSLGNLSWLRILNLRLNKNLREVPHSIKDLKNKGLKIYR